MRERERETRKKERKNSPPRHAKQPEARRLRPDGDPRGTPRTVRQSLGVDGLLPGRVLHPAAGVVVEQEIVGRAEQRTLFFLRKLGQGGHQLLERVRVVSSPRDAAEDRLGVDPQLRVQVPLRRRGVPGVASVERLGPLRVEVDADEPFFFVSRKQRAKLGDGPGVREKDVVRDDPRLDGRVAAGLAGRSVGAAPRGVDADVVAAELFFFFGGFFFLERRGGTTE